MKKKAFTLIELLIVIVVFSIIMASVLTVYINSQRAKFRVDMMVEAQQAARAALDFMIKDIRAAGYNIDLDEDATTTPQRRLVYAGPYELIFNANLKPLNDDPENPITPQAMDPTASPKPNNYNPVNQFKTGAETIVYTLDYNNDGFINATDRSTTESAFTHNPGDYALVKRVYGYDSTTTSNGGVNQIVSIVGGPECNKPMFTYWYDDDNDPLTDNKLFGDTNSDGVLSTAEIATLTAITNHDMLDEIKIITINITGLSKQPHRGTYYETNIKTEVSVTRNASIDVQIVTGHVYNDADGDSIFDVGEVGINGVKVRLSTGETVLTSGGGIWSFALIPGAYSVTCTPIVGFSPTSDLFFDFDIEYDDLDCTTDAVYKNFFGLEVTPTAVIFGFAFNDINADGIWDSLTDTLVGNVQISVWNNDTTTINDLTDPAFGFYLLRVNAEEDLYVWVSPPTGFACTGIDTIIEGLGPPASDPVNSFAFLSENDFSINLPAGNGKAVALAVIAAVGEAPTIDIVEPNGGEIYIIEPGTFNDIKVRIVDPEDEVIQRLHFFYSIDGGNNWMFIANLAFPTIPADSVFIYNWSMDDVIDDSIQGSTICKVKVGVEDLGHWLVYDESDSYFTLVGKEGYTSLFFTSETPDSTFDETVYLYGVGSDTTDVMANYLNTINSYAESAAWEVFKFNGTQFKRPFITQTGKLSEFITIKNVPYADTIYPGIWNFYLYGRYSGDDIADLKYFDFDVYKRDSTGDTLTETILFSTLDAFSCSIIYREPFTNATDNLQCSFDVFSGFDMDRSDRLYIKMFWSGEASITGGGDPEAMYFHFGGPDAISRFMLPPKP